MLDSGPSSASAGQGCRRCCAQDATTSPTNLVPLLTNLAPLLTNLAPLLTNLSPLLTNLAPRGTRRPPPLRTDRRAKSCARSRRRHRRRCGPLHCGEEARPRLRARASYGAAGWRRGSCSLARPAALGASTAAAAPTAPAPSVLARAGAGAGAGAAVSLASLANRKEGERVGRAS